MTTDYLSAADLGIDEDERETLIKIMNMLIKGEVIYDPNADTEARGFNMGSVVTRHKHGVCACIVGWSKLMSERPDKDGARQQVFDAPVRKLAFDPVRRLLPVSKKLSNLLDLFFCPIDRTWDLSIVTTLQAAEAIKNYLSTGAAEWDDIVDTAASAVDYTAQHMLSTEVSPLTRK